MKKGFYYIVSLLTILLLASCGTKKNTTASRFYHAFTTRYNIYFNGKEAFDEALKNQQDGYKENYSEMIYLYPVSAQPKDKREPGGPFDRTIEKSNKAIKLHSIRSKPPKKPGWRNDPGQRSWQEREEYNPFLKNSWLIMGQAQFYNADFLQASATFSYIVRHYAQEVEVVAEARLWQARCYSELGWFYEAEDILGKMNKNGIPSGRLKQYAAVYADYLIKNKQFEEAIPYLKTAIKAEKNRKQRTRMRYLLGQMYADQGLEGLAYKAFGEVVNANPPYELEFAARIRQTEVFSGTNHLKVVKMLERMGKSSKNKEYLDQVYYALGNVYLSREDTLNAIKHYQLGIDKSTQNGMDKAICQVKLGDIYFKRREYVKAQPCFSAALGGIRKEYKEYDRVSKLSAVLDELVLHVEAVHLQDSLQALAGMPEAERLAVIDRMIDEVKKAEKDEKAEAEKAAFLADQESKGTGIERPGTETDPTILPTGQGGSSFYFYNPQTVAQGKMQFQRKWGRRTLEDNWRRRKKELSTFDGIDSEGSANAGEGMLTSPITSDGQTASVDTLGTDLPPVAVDDPHTREYYLQQLPFTSEDREASDIIIVDGLYNMAMIYKDKLEDIPLAIEAFGDLVRRFPGNTHALESYYQTYLMALRTQNTALAVEYKAKLIREFPESDYAVAIGDPDYAYNIRRMDAVQDSLYQVTYDSYLAGDTVTVHRNYEIVREKYPLATLMPKFMFLHALSYVQAGDSEGFKTALMALVDKYPDADVTALASEMLKGALRGRTLVQGNVRGMVWTLRFGVGEDGLLSAEDSVRSFSPERNAPYEMLLIYPAGNVDRNQLLFTVATYNFANFMVKEFDLAFRESGPVTMLVIKGFVNFDEIIRYYHRIYGKDGYAASLDRAVTVLPISGSNYEVLMKGKTLDEYITFFEDTFGTELPGLSAHWKARMESDGEDAIEEMLVGEEVPVVDPAQKTQNPLSETIPSKDSDPAIQPPTEESGLSLKEIQEIRKREAAEEAARKEIARKEFEAQQKADKELQDQKAKERVELTRKQAEEERALLQTKADREKQLEQDRKAKQKRVEADRKSKLKAREELRKEKERAYKERLKQKEKERKEKAKAYREAQREKEKAAKRKAARR